MKRHVVATRQALLSFLKNRTQFYVSPVWFVIHIVFSQFVNEGIPLTNMDPLLVPIHPKKIDRTTDNTCGRLRQLTNSRVRSAPYPTFRKGVMEEKANINIFIQVAFFFQGRLS